MRACVQCGAENSDTADSCRSCGAVLEAQAATSVQPAAGPGTQPVQAQPQPTADGAGQWHQQAQPAATMVADQPAGTGPAPTELLGSGHGGPGSGLRRADALVLGASVLLFFASFLPFYDSEYGGSTNAWTWFLVPLLVVGFGSGVLAGLLVAVDRFTTVGDVAGKVGLTLHQLTGVLAVVSAVQLTLSVISAPLHGLAQWLALVAAALLLIGTVFARHVPALTVPVGTSAPRAPGAATSAPWAPAPTPAAAAPAPGAAATPFWFSVSAPVLVHDRADGSVRGELQPGRWYLATTSFGTAVEVSAEEFGTAILHDLSVLQRA